MSVPLKAQQYRLVIFKTLLLSKICYIEDECGQEKEYGNDRDALDD